MTRSSRHPLAKGSSRLAALVPALGIALLGMALGSRPAHAAAACAPQPGKSIHIDVSAQELTACQDGAVILDTPVTTGRDELPTPAGSYSVLRKSSPWLMHSPWGRHSRYWYPDSWVKYTLWFIPGYAIHDAPWRQSYGPGTETAGSHGCVNVPRPAMDQLYAWADVGDPVLIT